MRDVALSRVSPERTRLILMACPEFLSEVHDTIIKRYAAIQIYLHEVCGIDQDALHKPKDRLLGKARTPRTVRCGARATPPHRPRRAG
jgi:protein-tyrosine phosphatase